MKYLIIAVMATFILCSCGGTHRINCWNSAWKQKKAY